MNKIFSQTIECSNPHTLVSIPTELKLFSSYDNITVEIIIRDLNKSIIYNCSAMFNKIITKKYKLIVHSSDPMDNFIKLLMDTELLLVNLSSTNKFDWILCIKDDNIDKVIAEINYYI